MLGSSGGHGHPRSLPQEFHGRCDEQQGGGQQDGFLVREARAASPSSSFLGSTSSSSGGGGQMLSFSPNETAGLGLSSGGGMQGVLARVRGPFTPTQWMELEHQALIYKHIAANVSVPSSLLLPIRRSLHPWGWGSFPAGCADVEPRRCRRTDGKKWRCSRDAVGDQKYCERHINRGRHRSRKHVEGRKATLAMAEPSMAIAAGASTRSHTVARQKQVKSSAANVTDPFSRQSNRKQNAVDQLSPLDSFDFSSTQSSPNYENVALSPLKLHHDHDDESYIGHVEGSLSEKGNMMHEIQLTVSKETLDDGPLGEVFKRKNCQSDSANILTDKWTESPNLSFSPGIQQMATKFNSVSTSNTVNSGGTTLENHMTDNGYLTARMMNPLIVPTLL
ncbi:growth-regulating factor 8-like [Oryza brachyantha]|uniref:Growth-regulating factor n=1 Tax=Oryza brachyantha TaxID=4533 RepID=J3N903_ORYBR|nr:growth-regulating factor 8-like [Oryza brachyantha]